jgi:hypothetical protein
MRIKRVTILDLVKYNCIYRVQSSSTQAYID